MPNSKEQQVKKRRAEVQVTDATANQNPAMKGKLVSMIGQTTKVDVTNINVPSNYSVT